MKTRRSGGGRARLETPTGARAVPARSTSLGRGVLGCSEAFMLATPLRTGTVRGPVVAVSRRARMGSRFALDLKDSGENVICAESRVPPTFEPLRRPPLCLKINPLPGG